MKMLKKREVTEKMWCGAYNAYQPIRLMSRVNFQQQPATSGISHPKLAGAWDHFPIEVVVKQHRQLACTSRQMRIPTRNPWFLEGFSDSLKPSSIDHLRHRDDIFHCIRLNSCTCGKGHCSCSGARSLWRLGVTQTTRFCLVYRYVMHNRILSWRYAMNLWITNVSILIFL